MSTFVRIDSPCYSINLHLSISSGDLQVGELRTAASPAFISCHPPNPMQPCKTVPDPSQCCARNS